MPEKVFHIHEPDEDDLGAIDVKMDKSKGKSSSCKKRNGGGGGGDEEEFWWNRVNLTVLDLSSNSLTTISGDIKNLQDLVTLNVSNSLYNYFP